MIPRIVIRQHMVRKIIDQAADMLSQPMILCWDVRVKFKLSADNPRITYDQRSMRPGDYGSAICP